MNSLYKGSLRAALLFLGLFLYRAAGQLLGDQCVDRFKMVREDFVIDVDESVKDGATYFSSPKLDRYKDCIVACCKEPKCNVAFMERGAEEGMINSCFLFDCLYKKKYVCRFVRKKGYFNYVLDTVYQNYLPVDVFPSKTSNTLNICMCRPGDLKCVKKLCTLTSQLGVSV